MYGIIGKMVATAGKRDELIRILLEGTKDMPGCMSYIIAQDAGNENALWITEVWKSQADHTNSLALPSVQKAIGEGKPLIESFGERHETTPIGGQGINN